MNNNRRSIAIEIGLMFVLVMAIIWIAPLVFGDRPLGRKVQWGLGVLGMVVIFASWRCGRDTLGTLGIMPESFSQTLPMLIWSAVTIAILTAIAFLVNPNFGKRPDFWADVDEQSKCYIRWAFVQQLLMHGYFTNRMASVFAVAALKPAERSMKTLWRPALTVGILFAVAHLPNPILTPTTLVFGTFGAYFFLKSRNLYLLTLAHAILGTVVNQFLAHDLLENGMRIGPGFWK